MLITKEIEIDLWHRVTNHKSKCASLHWHRYKIEVWVNDKVIDIKWVSDENMVIDFWDLKEIMMNVLDKRFDHWFILWEWDSMVEAIKQDKNTKLTVVDFIPTAEWLCKYWFELIEPKLKEKWVKIEYLKIFETPTSTAVYTK